MPLSPTWTPLASSREVRASQWQLPVDSAGIGCVPLAFTAERARRLSLQLVAHFGSLPQIPPGNATLQALVTRPGRGSMCADCGAPAPSWAVLDEGQAGLVCGECAGVHRTGVTTATRNIFWDTITVEAAAVSGNMRCCQQGLPGGGGGQACA